MGLRTQRRALLRQKVGLVSAMVNTDLISQWGSPEQQDTPGSDLHFSDLGKVEGKAPLKFLQEVCGSHVYQTLMLIFCS